MKYIDLDAITRLVDLTSSLYTYCCVCRECVAYFNRNWTICLFFVIVLCLFECNAGPTAQTYPGMTAKSRTGVERVLRGAIGVRGVALLSSSTLAQGDVLFALLTLLDDVTLAAQLLVSDVTDFIKTRLNKVREAT